MSTLKIKVIVGSTRANRFSEKPAQWIFDLAKQRADLDVELLDLRDYPLPFFEEAMPPGLAKDSYTNPVVVKWRDKIREADGFIICTPEYNHGYPAVLKNALDYTYFAWARKAVAFVALGRRRRHARRRAAAAGRPSSSTWCRPAGPCTSPTRGSSRTSASIATDQNNNAAKALLDHLTWWTGALEEGTIARFAPSHHRALEFSY